MNILIPIILVIVVVTVVIIVRREPFVQYNLQELNFPRPLNDCDTGCIRSHTNCKETCNDHICTSDCDKQQSDCLSRCIVQNQYKCQMCTA